MAAETSARTIETSFKEFAARDDIAVILISQQVANQIRHIIAAHNKVGAAEGRSYRVAPVLSRNMRHSYP